jgi:hypothetical protein
VASVICISLTDQDQIFLEKLQLLGLKPSYVFRDALAMIRERIEKTGSHQDWQQLEKIRRLADKNYLLSVYLEKKNLGKDFDEWNQKAKDDINNRVN